MSNEALAKAEKGAPAWASHPKLVPLWLLHPSPPLLLLALLLDKEALGHSLPTQCPVHPPDPISGFESAAAITAVLRKQQKTQPRGKQSAEGGRRLEKAKGFPLLANTKRSFWAWPHYLFILYPPSLPSSVWGSVPFPLVGVLQLSSTEYSAHTQPKYPKMTNQALLFYKN